jgi:hypothetical protein
METISWTDRVKYEMLHKFGGKRNIVYTVKRRKVNWIGHILRWNCLLKHVIEGKIEESIKAKGRRKRRHKQPVDVFLISNFRRVLNVVCFFLGNSPASEFYADVSEHPVCSIFIYG